MTLPTIVHPHQKPIGVCSMEECTCYGCVTMRHACVKRKPKESK